MSKKPKPEKRTVQEAFHASLAEQMSEILKSRRINCCYCETAKEASDLVMKMIPKGAVVSQGGSATLDQTGIREALLQRSEITFIDPYADGLSPEEKITRRRQGLTADFFLCSTNAITRNGQLVNRDGMGNRVSAMIFGPRKVVVVAGMNKIVPDIETALARIETVAAPMNTRRLNRKTPCASTLLCEECSSPDRICAATTIIDWQMDPDRMWVILIGESLGF